MTTINADSELFTLINVFNVNPDKQQELVDLLIEATEQSMKHIPGFVSANIHKSSDGKKVVNYAQWQSRDHFEKMLSNPDAIPHMKKAEDLVESFDPIQTSVADSIST